jgi:hypothetical protein
VTVEALTIDGLERWVLFGAQWRIVELSDDWAVVDLCACTGERVERVETYDPAVIGYVTMQQDTARSETKETPP